MTTTIDAAGRIVIPKSIRDEAGLAPGTEISVELDDNDNVVLAATRTHWHTEKRDGLFVLVPDRPVPPLTDGVVEELIERIRTDRGRL